MSYDTKWWGWGDAAKRRPLPPRAIEFLASELGETGRQTPPIGLADVSLPAAVELPPGLVGAVGAERVLRGSEDRLRRSAGKSYPDLVRVRSGAIEAAPDAVLVPADREQVERVLAICASEGVAVVPYGGGTSVVGGVEPVRGRFERLISLDLSALKECAVDPVSQTAMLGPGLRGPEAEARVAVEGLTLGHFPQSYEYATIGGFAATRSAGQASSGYGRFDDVVTGVSMATPQGVIEALRTPHTAAGPALRELVVGSEGVLGVITRVRVGLRAAPARRLYRAWMVPGFAEGAELLRGLAQEEALPTVARVSDEQETRVGLAMSSAEGLARRGLELYLKARRRERGCLLITGYEGTHEAVLRAQTVAERSIRAAGGVSLGEAGGRSWERGRYEGPYLRDELLDRGIFVETLETAHTWEGLDRLYREVREAIGAALSAQGTPGLVLCHISHAYRDGASLYFTFFAQQRPGAELEQWRQVKAAACEAIVACGATITHHHAIGRDHAPYMRSEVGDLGIEALRALKERLDPTGVMNPGKLLPS